MITERHIPAVLNSDDDPRYFTMSDAFSIQNCRIGKSLNGKDLRIENIPSTALVPGDPNTNPSEGNTYTCIGSCIDTDSRMIIYALYYTGGDHKIMAYDLVTGNFYTVFQPQLLIDPTLNQLDFSLDKRIDRNMRVINGQLLWTNNNGEVKSIDIKAGINYYQPGTYPDHYAYVQGLHPEDTTLIKAPPIRRLQVEKILDSSFDNNFIQYEAFQFAWFYTYRNGQQSALSPWSDLVPYNPWTGTEKDYNCVEVTVPNTPTDGEYYSQDVLIINLCVRYGNVGKTYLVKTWDKRNPDDAADIAQAINTTTGYHLMFRFYNNIIGDVLDDVQSVNNFDNVPQMAKTLEVAKNRVFLGNVLNGYDTPASTSLACTAEYDNTIPFGRNFKDSSYYRIGITFFDRYRRKCGIVTNDSLVVNIPVRDTVTTVSEVYNVINWTLSNVNRLAEIPEWAYYYQISITKNQLMDFFVENLCSSIECYYATKDVNGNYEFTAQDYDANSTVGFAIDIRRLQNLGMGYVFTEGDQAIIVGSETGTGGFNLKVIAQSGNYVILTPYDFGNLAGTGSPILGGNVETTLYTPHEAALNEPFYECSDVYNITLPGGPNRAYGTLSGQLYGDVYLFGFAQRMSPSEIKWQDWERNLGWINLRDTIGQQKLETTIAFSDTFIAGSQVNGIGKFQALNSQSLTNDTGPIQKLILSNKIAQEQGTVMLCICQNTPLSIYLGETQLVSAEGNAYVAQSVGVIGTINALRGNYGTLHPESVIDYLGEVWWYDVAHGRWIMYSSNGAISVNYKMDAYFKKFGDRYLTQRLSKRIISSIDPIREHLIAAMPETESADYPYTIPSYGGEVPEYATTIKSQFDPYDGRGKMLMLDMKNNAWRYSIGIVPEWLEYSENGLYGFLNGTLHRFESGSDYNTFLGQQLPARVAFPASQAENAVGSFNDVKELFSMSIEGDMIPEYVLAYAKYPNEQVTDRSADDIDMEGNQSWANENGVMYVGFLKDRLSPNVTGTAVQKMFGGDYIRSVTPFILCEFWAYNEQLQVNALNLNYGITSGHK